MRLPFVSLACVLVLALLTAQPAAAAFPGDNGRIAFVSDRHGNDEIYTAAADGSDPQRLTTTSLAEAQPAFSPDATRIAFARTGDIWIMNADGSAAGPLTGTEGAGDAARVLPARRRKLRIPNVRRDERAVVTVAGQRSDDLAGPGARVKVKAARRR
jgi:hypothetical protein